jgi:hypothetical protein
VVLAVLGCGRAGDEDVPVLYRVPRDPERIVRAKAAGGTRVEMQQAFDKNAEINNIDAITPRTSSSAATTASRDQLRLRKADSDDRQRTC